MTREAGKRFAAPEEGERKRTDLAEGNAHAHAAALRIGVRPHNRIVAARLR